MAVRNNDLSELTIKKLKRVTSRSPCMVVSPRCFPHSKKFRYTYSLASVRYVIIQPHISALRTGVFRRSGRGRDVVQIRWLLLAAKPIPIRHLSRYEIKTQNHPSMKQLFRPGQQLAGTHIQFQPIVWYMKKGIMEETILAIRIIRVHHRPESWHNLRYIRSLETLWLIPHPSPPLRFPKINRKNSVERKALFQDPPSC